MNKQVRTFISDRLVQIENYDPNKTYKINVIIDKGLGEIQTATGIKPSNLNSQLINDSRLTIGIYLEFDLQTGTFGLYTDFQKDDSMKIVMYSVEEMEDQN